MKESFSKNKKQAKIMFIVIFAGFLILGVITLFTKASGDDAFAAFMSKWNLVTFAGLALIGLASLVQGLFLLNLNERFDSLEEKMDQSSNSEEVHDQGF